MWRRQYPADCTESSGNIAMALLVSVRCPARIDHREQQLACRTFHQAHFRSSLNGLRRFLLLWEHVPTARHDRLACG
jgi:hypothetical protein